MVVIANTMVIIIQQHCLFNGGFNVARVGRCRCEDVFALAGSEWYVGVEESGTIMHFIMSNISHNHYAL